MIGTWQLIWLENAAPATKCFAYVRREIAAPTTKHISSDLVGELIFPSVSCNARFKSGTAVHHADGPAPCH